MSEYVKGKWEATIINDMVYIVSAHKEIAIICTKPDANHLYKPATMEANAHLIVAAPALLAACKDFVKGWLHFCNCIDFGRSNLDADAIRFMNEVPGKIEQAIKTAAGKEQIK